MDAGTVEAVAAQGYEPRRPSAAAVRGCRAGVPDDPSGQAQQDAVRQNGVRSARQGQAQAAADNGFDLDPEHTADWLSFGSSQTSMRIWLTAVEESQFLAAASRADVLDGLAGLGVASAAPLPSDALPRAAAGALAVGDVAALHRLLHRAFQLSRTRRTPCFMIFTGRPRTCRGRRKPNDRSSGGSAKTSSAARRWRG